MSERIKELREWGTFLLTLATVVAVPIGALILHDQKLEIRNEVADKYATKTDMQSFENLTNNKLDRLNEGVEHVRNDVATIKGQLAKTGP